MLSRFRVSFSEALSPPKAARNTSAQVLPSSMRERVSSTSPVTLATASPEFGPWTLVETEPPTPVLWVDGLEPPFNERANAAEQHLQGLCGDLVVGQVTSHLGSRLPALSIRCTGPSDRLLRHARWTRLSVADPRVSVLDLWSLGYGPDFARGNNVVARCSSRSSPESRHALRPQR